MSTEKQNVQGSEKSKFEQVTCVACGKSFDGDPDRMWLMPLSVIEQSIRKVEGFERWARPEDLKKHAMCGQCGHLVRETGGKTYRLSATMKIVVERKVKAEEKRRARAEANSVAEREAAKVKIGQLYNLELSQERNKGRFTGKKKVKVDRAEECGDDTNDGQE